MDVAVDGAREHVLARRVDDFFGLQIFAYRNDLFAADRDVRRKNGVGADHLAAANDDVRFH